MDSLLIWVETLAVPIWAFRVPKDLSQAANPRGVRVLLRYRAGGGP
jgi:hypothetical protein